MMRKKVYTREGENAEKTKSSYTIAYYRITVEDSARICNSKLVDELFECYKSGMLEWRLNRLRKKHKRLETEVEDHGTIATVTIKKRPLLKK